MGQLENKIAIITGATSGIGRRTAERFVEEGAKVVCCGRRTDLGEALEKSLGRKRCRFVGADVTREADVQHVIEACVETFGRVDCLFNNAGGPAPTGGIAGIPVEGFDAAMALLVRSVMLGMKHAAPVMMRQRSGSIINNASVAASRAGYSSSMIYSAAKAAVVQLSRCVAMELGEHNVRVNCISPGAIAADLGERVMVASRTEGLMEFNTRTRTVVRGAGSGLPLTGNTGVAIDSHGQIYGIEAGACTATPNGRARVFRSDLTEAQPIPLGLCAGGATTTLIPVETLLEALN